MSHPHALDSEIIDALRWRAVLATLIDEAEFDLFSEIAEELGRTRNIDLSAMSVAEKTALVTDGIDLYIISRNKRGLNT